MHSTGSSWRFYAALLAAPLTFVASHVVLLPVAAPELVPELPVAVRIVCGVVWVVGFSASVSMMASWSVLLAQKNLRALLGEPGVSRNVTAGLFRAFLHVRCPSLGILDRAGRTGGERGVLDVYVRCEPTRWSWRVHATVPSPSAATLHLWTPGGAQAAGARGVWRMLPREMLSRLCDVPSSNPDAKWVPVEVSVRQGAVVTSIEAAFSPWIARRAALSSLTLARALAGIEDSRRSDDAEVEEPPRSRGPESPFMPLGPRDQLEPLRDTGASGA